MANELSRTGKYEIDMTQGALLPKILLFSVPLMLSSMMQLLFNAADIVVVGRFGGDVVQGARYVAAIGSTGSCINLLLSVLMGLSVGVNVLAARYYAARQKKELSETVQTTITVAIAGGAAVGLAGALAARYILTLMGSPEEVIGLSVLYMRIYFAGLPVTMVYNFGSAVLRAAGDTRRPLYYLMAAGFLNVGLNLIFVCVLHMNVAGVALATVLSQVLSASLILRSLTRPGQLYSLDLGKLRIYGDKFRRIVGVGLPAGLQGAIFSLSNVLIQSSINEFGSIAMAGSAAGANLEGFVYMAMNSVYQASVSFTSQNIGAKRMDRIGKVLGTCLAVVAVIGLVLGNLFYHFGDRLVGIYTQDTEAIARGVERMGIICTMYFMCGMMDVVCGSLRGMGYSAVPMIVSVVGACGLRILWILTIFRSMHSLTVLYVSYPVSWFVTGAVHFICYLIIVRKFKMSTGTALIEEKQN